MAQRLDTPGVYIREENAFPNSVAGLPTAVPAFVGYTQNILKDGASLVNKPIRLTSMAEFTQIFGGAPKATFKLREFDAATDSIVDLAAGSQKYVIEFDRESRFLLYDSMRLFFCQRWQQLLCGIGWRFFGFDQKVGTRSGHSGTGERRGAYHAGDPRGGNARIQRLLRAATKHVGTLWI